MLSHVFNSAVAAVNSYDLLRELFAVLIVVGKNSITFAAKSICPFILSADRHFTVLLHILSSNARTCDKLQFMGIIAGICKYAGALEFTAQLVSVPAAETLSDKYIVI